MWDLARSFAAYFILIGKRKPAKFVGIFYALVILLAITAVTPVWSVNAPTAYEVKYNGKGQPFFLSIMPKCTSAMANLTLSKESSGSEIERYFNAILELSKSDNEFPINLDEVWMLVYSEKSKAVRALKENFIENVDFQPLAQNGERLSNGQFAGGGTTYYLTLSCMEFFIARKVRPVFEVYRQVFHKVAKQELTLTPAELLLKQSQLLVDNERKMRQIESRQEVIEKELAEVKQRTTTTLDQSTIVAYISRNKIKLDVTKFGAIGRKASMLCKKRGVEVTRINDVRWGLVNVYPDSILDEVFQR